MKMFLGLVLFFGSIAQAQGPASAENVKLEKVIKSSPIYKKYIKTSGAVCEGVEEVQTTKEQSTIEGESTVFKLVILDCSYDPDDGGDPIRHKGLALVSVYKDESRAVPVVALLSITPGSFSQPD